MVDLLMGGSPCQGFSFAGKQLNFKDERSKLFFEFVKAKEILKPKYFLLENVKMKKEYQDKISELLGVEPIEIDSKNYSAQQRKRLYWTNIKGVKDDKTSESVIADVIGVNVVNKRQNRILMNKADFDVKVRKHNIDKSELASFLRSYKNKTITQIAKECDAPKTMVDHWFRTDNSFSIPSEEYWFRLKKCLGVKDDKFDKAVCEFEHKKSNFDMAKRIYHVDGKHPTLTTLTKTQRKSITNGKEMFRLKPVHCEKLQTLTEGYTQGISDRQRFKALGNGWTVDVIAHIFSYIQEQKLQNIVSLYDGISCGQVALNRANKTYTNYYASEIDKYAIQITQKNYPGTHQIGDITKIDFEQLKERCAGEQN